MDQTGELFAHLSNSPPLVQLQSYRTDAISETLLIWKVSAMNTHLQTWHVPSALLLTLLALGSLSACSEKSAQPKQPDEKKTEVSAPAPTPNPPLVKPKTDESFANRPYKIRVVPGDAANGKAATSVIEITPTAGYKMNQDFPSRLRIDASQAAQLSKTDFRGPDVQVSDAKVRFDVNFTPKQAGSIPMSGIADFSVCNESTCKLYRGERVVWDVAVR